jgi:beta-lactamase class D
MEAKEEGMNKIVRAITLLLLVSTAPLAYAEDPDIAQIFTEKNLNGALVISSLDGGTTYIHNEERAGARLVPASTFKILNTLIALEENAVANEKEIIEWDGKDRELEAWNKDQSLETAFPASCVWFYQELAKRVGTAKYERYLRETNYGNANAGGELTTFWLKGDLKISAIEQVAFLKNIYRRKYPFRLSSYDILAKLMVVEQTPTRTVRAKTGWAQRPGVGWYVGYVESDGNVWFFATNIDVSKPEDNRLRQAVTYEALKLKGIM